ncbi:MAG: CRISPR-associated helicase Cas3' [Caldilineaceae bacterium]|nr:CRISPR-associated helicase Cas3' [Caldilineaceae bacterium]
MTEIQLYPYQELVAKHILSGKNVILQAPTGTGKTIATILPFLHARQHLNSDSFPRKCIYSVPMRVLANQFHEEYTKIIRRYGWQDSLRVERHTGDQPDDPKMEGDLTFTTIDQTLSNFLNIPYSLGRRSANLNAGAVLASYLIFDEFHLYDPDVMLPTTLEMLRMLRSTTPFVVMTATFSSKMLTQLAEYLNAIVVPGNEEDRQKMMRIGSQIGKTRRFFAVDGDLTSDAVLGSEATGHRVICICNTVARAQSLYLSLKERLDDMNDSETKICLLHSSFYKNDRHNKEQWIAEQFGLGQDEYDGPKLILIATQVIEVGLDVTCDVIHTELAPAASVLQRAGRCARRAGEKGEVYIYLARNDEGEPDYTPYFLKNQPYKTARGRELCERTWQALKLEKFSGQHMDFEREQELIDEAHTATDQEIFDELEGAQSLRLEEMLQTMREQDRGAGPELIRNANSRYIFVHTDPNNDEQLRRNPWHYDGFTRSPGMVAAAFNSLEKIVDGETPWIMQSAYPISDRVKRGEEAPSRQPAEYRWVSVGDGAEAAKSLVLAIHPSIAQYSSELGFRFATTGLSADQHIAPVRPKKGEPTSYNYRRETFSEHVMGLLRAYQNAQYEIAFATRRLEERMRFPHGTLDRMLRILFVCHDLGKLSSDWQKWAHEWQRQVGMFYGDADMSVPIDYMAAHTDFEPTAEQKQLQRKLRKRPNHAGESAVAAIPLLEDFCAECEALFRAAMSSIARHHHPSTDSYQSFAGHLAAGKAVQDALRAVGFSPILAERVDLTMDGREPLSRMLVRFDARHLDEVLLYFLLVRTLRLADQRSQLQ